MTGDDRPDVLVHRACLPAAQALWTAAAQRVLDDLMRTTGRRWPWQVAVHEDEAVWPELPPLAPEEAPAAYRSVLTITFGPQQPQQRRPLALPELWLELKGYAVLPLEVYEDDPEHAAALLAEAVQDRVIDELWTAWPPCPAHGHPLQAGVRVGQAVWRCPAGEAPEVPVGRLGGPF